MASPDTTGLDLEAWSSTEIGAPQSWSRALHTAAQLCLAYPSPCCLLWGEQSWFFYNTAMAASIGMRHPAGMGHPLYEVLPEMWRTVGPLVHEVMRSGESFTASRFPIEADIGEGVEQFFVDFTFVPVREGDRVVGVFAPVGNNTLAHLDGQHHLAVAAIATVPTSPPGEVAAQVARHLVGPDDVRFAVIFRRDPATGTFVRVAAGGAPLRPASTLTALDVAVARGLWPLEQVLRDGGAPVPVAGAATGSRGTRPLWEDVWLVGLPDDRVLVLGLDRRFVLPAGPRVLVAQLAAVAGERLAREGRLTG